MWAPASAVVPPHPGCSGLFGGGCGAAVSSVRLRPLLALSGRGGGSGGGPLVPWRRPLAAGGGGRHGGPSPRGQPLAGGSHPSPAPLYLEPDPRAGPRWGPSAVNGLQGSWFPPALVVSALPLSGVGALSCVMPYRGGGVGRGAQLPPPLSRVRRLGRHLRRRLCWGWGCGGGGLRRR